MHALVLALILSPVEVPMPSWAPESAWLALTDLSQKLEIVGPHEQWRKHSWHSELRYVRQYVRELADAPSIVDAYRFPGSVHAHAACAANCAYQDHLNCRLQVLLHQAPEMAEVVTEAKRLYEIWSAVRDASDTQFGWATRRVSLKRLRDLLGPEAYYASQLPPAAPVWHFQRRD